MVQRARCCPCCFMGSFKINYPDYYPHILLLLSIPAESSSELLLRNAFPRKLSLLWFIYRYNLSTFCLPKAHQHLGSADSSSRSVRGFIFYLYFLTVISLGSNRKSQRPS